MNLANGIIATPLAHPGMRVGDALRICVDKGVPGIPFAGADGRIRGRFSVRHAFLGATLPSDMVKGAHLIGHRALHLEHTSDHYRDLFRQPIDAIVLDDIACLSSGAQITKAMALMERHNSSYLFVVDDGLYRGVVTRLGLTRVLLETHE